MNERVFLPHKKKKLTSFQIIILGFLGVILLGTVFLMQQRRLRMLCLHPPRLFASQDLSCMIPQPTGHSLVRL